MADRDFGELLARAAGGDEGAWRILVTGLSALLLGIARSYRLGDADASDVCQSTWITLAQRTDAIRDPARLPYWLATTARRQALLLLKSRRREIPTEQYDMAEESPPPDLAVLSDQRTQAMWRAIERLPDRDRHLMHLLAQDPPPTHVEIAERLGILPGGVGPLRRRTLDRVRRMMEVDGWGYP